jgi:hypothetical protein
MTSVLNHLLQLSGNKYIILGILCLVLSCSSKRYALEQNKLKSDYEKQQTKSNPKTVDPIPVKKAHIDTLDQIFPIIKKSNYTIAFILPLNLEANDPYESQQKGLTRSALEFYMGSVIALQNESENSKSTFKVYIFDCRNTTGSISTEIIPELSKIKPDLVIGSFISDQLKILYKYCSDHKINLLNPLISPDSFTNLNPYFFTLRPSEKTHLNYISELLNRNFLQYNISILAETNQEKDQYYKTIRTLIDTNKFGEIKAYKADESNWRNPYYIKNMKEGKNVFLIFNKNNEVVINSLLTNLIGIQNKEETAIIAPYGWLYQNTIDLGFLQTMNTHFITDYYFNYNDSTNFDFISRYRTKYNSEPNIMACIGYAYTNYFMSMLNDKGIYFQRDLLKATATMDSTVSIKMIRLPGQFSFQNYHMTILHYEGSELKQLNLK